MKRKRKRRGFRMGPAERALLRDEMAAADELQLRLHVLRAAVATRQEAQWAAARCTGQESELELESESSDGQEGKGDDGEAACGCDDEPMQVRTVEEQQPVDESIHVQTIAEHSWCDAAAVSDAAAGGGGGGWAELFEEVDRQNATRLEGVNEEAAAALGEFLASQDAELKSSPPDAAAVNAADDYDEPLKAFLATQQCPTTESEEEESEEESEEEGEARRTLEAECVDDGPWWTPPPAGPSAKEMAAVEVAAVATATAPPVSSLVAGFRFENVCLHQPPSSTSSTPPIRLMTECAA